MIWDIVKVRRPKRLLLYVGLVGALMLYARIVYLFNPTPNNQATLKRKHVPVGDYRDTVRSDQHNRYRLKGKSQAGCLKKILVLGDMDNVTGWTGINRSSNVWNFIEPFTSKNDAYHSGIFDCRRYNCSIELTFSSDYTAHAPDKDAIVLNVVPATLVEHMNKLLPHREHQPQDNDQLWVYYSLETALSIYTIHNSRIGNLSVHGVWSYLSDSEITTQYGYYKPGLVDQNEILGDNFWAHKSKTRLVTWMASNCDNTFWPRMEFVQELQKYVSVDTYGKCGDLSCLPFRSEQCKHLMSSYKFYLSLENAECQEYVTKKVWESALKYGVVPIVYGAAKADYQRLAPPNSFIYAGDFKSVKDLAAYIKLLDTRTDLYAKYFEWRHKGSVVPCKSTCLESNRDLFCETLPLIDQMKKGGLEKKPISSFRWFNSCRIKPLDFRNMSALQNWIPW